MSGSSSGDSMGWGRGRPSSSRKGKRGRGGDGNSGKPRQPQRGLGVAQLEKIRIQNEMAEFLHHPHGQPPLIHGTGSLNLEDTRSSNSFSSSPSSSFQSMSTTAVSSPYSIHPNLAMAYGERSGDMRYGELQSTPTMFRSPSNGSIYGAAHYSHQTITLPLFEPVESNRLKKQHIKSQLVDLTGLDSEEAQDVDLELKL